MFYTNVKVWGNNILHCFVDNDGVRRREKIEFQPTLYLPSNNPTQFKTLSGKYVKEIQWGSIKDCKGAVEKYKDIDNFEIYGNTKWVYQFIGKQYSQENIDWDVKKINTAYIDIETDSSGGFPDIRTANKEIISITYYMNGIYWVYGTKPYTPKLPNVKFVLCQNEVELLRCFVNRWSDVYPDIITGWNIDGFDIPYLIVRITDILGEDWAKRLSPWNTIQSREVFDNQYGRTNVIYEIFGISSIDYMAAYKKFTYKVRESYRLDYIAEVELKENKLSYDEYGSLDEFYKQNYEKFIDYNIHDVTIVIKLEEKLRLMELILTLAYYSKINYQDPFFQVRMWDALIYNHLMKSNIVIPQQKDSVKNTQYEGAYVKDPIIGKHKWIVSFDLNSLYPHLIMQYNISPEKLIDPKLLPQELCLLRNDVNVDSLLERKMDLELLKKYDITMTPNGQFFRRDSIGFLPEMMEQLYNNRKAFKKKMIDAKKRKESAKTQAEKDALDHEISRYSFLEKGMKVTLNSAYGALGNAYFRFFDVRQASAVTTSGQLSIRWIEGTINEYMNRLLKTDKVDYVPYIDTDSVYISFEGVVNKTFKGNLPETKKVIEFIDTICNDKFDIIIKSGFEELGSYVNAFAQKMEMKREAIASDAIWTGKKRYALSVWDNEGVVYTEPDMKVMGMEIVKSSTPNVCRNSLKAALNLTMNGNEEDVITFIKNFRDEYDTFTPEQIASPRGINGLNKFFGVDMSFKNGTPIHVRGAGNYNRMLSKLGLQNKYPKIGDGDKIKFVYLQSPNHSGEHVIAFPNTLPKEFELDKYIDRNEQFDKTFLSPLKIILDSIGWKHEKRGSLKSFKKAKT